MLKEKIIKIYIDGACGPINPGGTATYGLIVKNKKGKVIFADNGIIGKGENMSNNLAEYAGLVEGLKWLIKQNYKKIPVTFYSDSMLLIKQMQGFWRIKKGRYVELAQEAIILLKKFNGNISFKWIPREENFEADEFSKKV